MDHALCTIRSAEHLLSRRWKQFSERPECMDDVHIRTLLEYIDAGGKEQNWFLKQGAFSFCDCVFLDRMPRAYVCV